jgi:hypothetical protein
MPESKLAGLSVEDLRKEIVRRQRALPALIAERDQLDRQIAELQALGAVKSAAQRGGKARGRRRMRKAVPASRPGSLTSALVDALKNNDRLTVAQAVEAVRMGGYESRSKNFQRIVRMTLSKGKQFRRVGRGVYALKG